jgi:hypothetical protein
MSFIDDLEAEWDVNGFLDRLRGGVFQEPDAQRFLQLLRGIHIADDEQVPKRAVSMLWYLPTFLLWQRERVAERGSDLKAYDLFVTAVHNTLEEVLGVP